MDGGPGVAERRAGEADIVDRRARWSANATARHQPDAVVGRMLASAIGIVCRRAAGRSCARASPSVSITQDAAQLPCHSGREVFRAPLPGSLPPAGRGQLALVVITEHRRLAAEDVSVPSIPPSNHPDSGGAAGCGEAELAVSPRSVVLVWIWVKIETEPERG